MCPNHATGTAIYDLPYELEVGDAYCTGDRGVQQP